VIGQEAKRRAKQAETQKTERRAEKEKTTCYGHFSTSEKTAMKMMILLMLRFWLILSGYLLVEVRLLLTLLALQFISCGRTLKF